MAKKAFSNALDTIKEAVVDFSQLNVRTFVGTITVTVDNDGNPDWDALMNTAVVEGAVKLAASTTIHLDGDCDYLEDPTAISPELREAHQDAVEAGKASRQAIIDLIGAKISTLVQ